jgi:hypothetical protein
MVDTTSYVAGFYLEILNFNRTSYLDYEFIIIDNLISFIFIMIYIYIYILNSFVFICSF